MSSVHINVNSGTRGLRLTDQRLRLGLDDEHSRHCDPLNELERLDFKD